MDKEQLYNDIGERFEEFTNTAAQRIVEIRTLMHMAGDVSNLNILDLACGYGFFGRELLAKGALRVVGVDISEKMIDLARQESEKNGDSIEFHVRDACEMESFGEFDMVMAAWLFNYAETPEDLSKMLKAVSRNLKPSGRLIAYTVEPNFSLDKGNFIKYGVNVHTEEPWLGGFRHQASFVTNPPSPFTFFRWSREIYEQAITEAGFRQMQWQKPILLENDIKQCANGFWDIFQNNCLQTGFNCLK